MGPGDAHGVALLEGVAANGCGRGLAADDHHGDRVGVGGGNAGDRVGQARARCHQSHTHFVSGAGKAVGGMHSRLLVAHQHVFNGVLLVQRVVDVQHRAAGIAPQVLDTFGLQRLNENFGAHQFEGTSRRSGDSRRLLLGLGDIHDQPL